MLRMIVFIVTENIVQLGLVQWLSLLLAETGLLAQCSGGDMQKGRRMSRVEAMIGMFCVMVICLICATMACYAMFSILIRLPVSNPFVWWTLDSYTGFATVFGSVFLLTFGVLISLYRLALRRAR